MKNSHNLAVFFFKVFTLIPFLLAENENMIKEEASAESRRLMNGMTK